MTGSRRKSVPRKRKFVMVCIGGDLGAALNRLLISVLWLGYAAIASSLIRAILSISASAVWNSV